eukprot:2225249-Karenia_brevis.AAC.1
MPNSRAGKIALREARRHGKGCASRALPDPTAQDDASAGADASPKGDGKLVGVPDSIGHPVCDEPSRGGGGKAEEGESSAGCKP